MAVVLALISGCCLFLFTLVLLDVLQQFWHKKMEQEQTNNFRRTGQLFSLKRTGLDVFKKLALLHKGFMFPRYKAYFQRQIFLAGLEEAIDFEGFLIIKEAIGLLALLVLWSVAGDLLGIWLCLLLAATSFLLPDLWLKEKVLARQKTVLKALPDTLDLLTACVEAGLGFEAALYRVVEGKSKEPLSQEIRQVLQEIKLGKTRKEALVGMAQRVDLAELTTLIHALLQAEQLGTGLAGSLRVQAEELRVKRKQRAEKLALEAPVKLLFPLLIFIFPVVFMVIFTPIVMQLMDSLSTK